MKGFAVYISIAGIVALIVTTIGNMPAQTKTKWFSYTNGDTTCAGFKIANTVPQINIQCSNSRGSISAGYTATGLELTKDTITFGVTSQTPANSILCFIGINSTLNSVTLGSLGLIAPKSAAVQCGADTPVTTQMWP